MFVDSSAMIGIIAQEDDWRSLAARLAQADRVYVSALAIWEAVVGLVRKATIPFAEAEELVGRFVEETRAQIIEIGAGIGQEALRASRLYGKGRHPADLNFGDCFAYACARTCDIPLLFKGDDFSRTDIAVA